MPSAIVVIRWFPLQSYPLRACSTRISFRFGCKNTAGVLLPKTPPVCFASPSDLATSKMLCHLEKYQKLVHNRCARCNLIFAIFTILLSWHFREAARAREGEAKEQLTHFPLATVRAWDWKWSSTLSQGRQVLPPCCPARQTSLWSNVFDSFLLYLKTSPSKSSSPSVSKTDLSVRDQRIGAGGLLADVCESCVWT